MVLGRRAKGLAAELAATPAEVPLGAPSRWTDPDFPPDEVSLTGGASLDSRPHLRAALNDVTWVRISELWGPNLPGVPRPALLPPAPGGVDPRPGAVVQTGSPLGNNYLAGALSALARRPGRVGDWFPAATEAEGGGADGRWLIRLPGAGIVWVDDFVPCVPVAVDDDDGGAGAAVGASHDLDASAPPRWRPAFTRAAGGEVWPCLVEKALAKRAGSYLAAERGHPAACLRDLTGAPDESWRLCRGARGGDSGAGASAANAGSSSDSDSDDDGDAVRAAEEAWIRGIVAGLDAGDIVMAAAPGGPGVPPIVAEVVAAIGAGADDSAGPLSPSGPRLVAFRDPRGACPPGGASGSQRGRLPHPGAWRDDDPRWGLADARRRAASAAERAGCGLGAAGVWFDDVVWMSWRRARRRFVDVSRVRTGDGPSGTTPPGVSGSSDAGNRRVAIAATARFPPARYYGAATTLRTFDVTLRRDAVGPVRLCLIQPDVDALVGPGGAWSLPGDGETDDDCGDGDRAPSPPPRCGAAQLDLIRVGGVDENGNDIDDEDVDGNRDDGGDACPARGGLLQSRTRKGRASALDLPGGLAAGRYILLAHGTFHPLSRGERAGQGADGFGGAMDHGRDPGPGRRCRLSLWVPVSAGASVAVRDPDEGTTTALVAAAARLARRAIFEGDILEGPRAPDEGYGRGSSSEGDEEGREGRGDGGGSRRRRPLGCDRGLALEARFLRHAGGACLVFVNRTRFHFWDETARRWVGGGGGGGGFDGGSAWVCPAVGLSGPSPRCSCLHQPAPDHLSLSPTNSYPPPLSPTPQIEFRLTNSAVVPGDGVPVSEDGHGRSGRDEGHSGKDGDDGRDAVAVRIPPRSARVVRVGPVDLGKEWGHAFLRRWSLERDQSSRASLAALSCQARDAILAIRRREHEFDADPSGLGGGGTGGSDGPGNPDGEQAETVNDYGAMGAPDLVRVDAPFEGGVALVWFNRTHAPYDPALEPWTLVETVFIEGENLRVTAVGPDGVARTVERGQQGRAGGRAPDPGRVGNRTWCDGTVGFADDGPESEISSDEGGGSSRGGDFDGDSEEGPGGTLGGLGRGLVRRTVRVVVPPAAEGMVLVSAADPGRAFSYATRTRSVVREPRESRR